jgi:hypothetical protein
MGEKQKDQNPQPSYALVRQLRKQQQADQASQASPNPHMPTDGEQKGGMKGL